MPRRFKRGRIVIRDLPHEDLVSLAINGDSEAIKELWEWSMVVAGPIATRFHSKYPWVDAADLTQNILIAFPKILPRFKPEKGVVFAKYLYFGFYRAAQDALRREDPLGVCIPQKMPYPNWMHITTQSEIDDRSGFGSSAEHVILDGLQRLDDGEFAVCNRPKTKVNS